MQLAPNINRNKNYFLNLPKYVDKNLKEEIDIIIKPNESLDEQTIKTRLFNYCSNKSIFHEHKKQ